MIGRNFINILEFRDCHHTISGDYFRSDLTVIGGQNNHKRDRRWQTDLQSRHLGIATGTKRGSPEANTSHCFNAAIDGERNINFFSRPVYYRTL